MPNVLLIAPITEINAKIGAASALICCLQSAGYSVVCMALDREAESVDILLNAFDGRPPDILLTDLSKTQGIYPLLHTWRLLRYVWGDDLPPPSCLCLLSPTHLCQTDWMPFTDDFLLSPYVPAELLTRLALLRFRRHHVATDNMLRFADIVLDLIGKRALTSGMHPLPLTPREYGLLEFLITHNGKFFGRDRLLDLVWGVNFEGSERTVDIHIRRLRAKLPNQAANRLQTRRGMGYGFER